MCIFKFRLFYKILSLFIVFILSSCSQSFLDHSIPGTQNEINSDGIVETVEESFAQFQDIPIPQGSIMNIEKTLLLGERETWIGRLVITNPLTPAKIFDFYKQKLNNFNWNEITSVRSTISVLTYSLNDRIMTIQIQPIKYGQYQSAINITMSPRLLSNKQTIK
ncbi:hypothetical protein OAC11_03595 [Alphaproteobacteria bacterium]|jgi:hypothetical protein|nr:hypothetical protein [Alphaproteobacteria bacterium]